MSKIEIGEFLLVLPDGVEPPESKIIEWVFEQMRHMIKEINKQADELDHEISGKNLAYSIAVSAFFTGALCGRASFYNKPEEVVH